MTQTATFHVISYNTFVSWVMAGLVESWKDTFAEQMELKRRPLLRFYARRHPLLNTYISYMKSGHIGKILEQIFMGPSINEVTLEEGRGCDSW